MTKHILPDLPYAYNALEPYIDAKTMEIHHDRHHAAYVDKLNLALDRHPHLYERPLETLLADPEAIPADIRDMVRNHGGGHHNHSLFWKVLGGRPGDAPGGELLDALNNTFGTHDNFRTEFNLAATNRFGSGWAWLSLDGRGKLVIHSTANQDSPLMEGLVPVLGLDVWEHAYYLSYQNRRPDYVNAFWNVVNWKEVAANYRNALEAVAAARGGTKTRKAS